MPQTYRVPYRGSATLGRGFNAQTGEFVGKALKVNSMDKLVPDGADAFYETQIIESYDSLMQSLGLSVEASGRYGLFSAEGKFGLSEKTSFNETSTFVVASCRVQNAFEMIDECEVMAEARPLLEEPDKWKTAFGTSFVRGLQTGGELFIILQSTSASQEMQSKVAGSFQAACQGLIASTEFKAAYTAATESKAFESKVTILMYQRAGQDEQIGYINTPDEIIKRLKDFPAIARAHPAGYEVEVADYNTLALPDVNDEEVADREASLTDCARLRLKYMTRRNEIDFARENRSFFTDLPLDEELGDLWEKYQRAIGAVQLHAQKIAGRKIPPTLFDLSALQPPLDLPVINFQRVNVSADIPVPPLVGDAVDFAKGKLQSFGLKSESHYVIVDENSGALMDTVIAQDPPEGTTVQPGSTVRLTQNKLPTKFSALKIVRRETGQYLINKVKVKDGVFQRRK